MEANQVVSVKIQNITDDLLQEMARRVRLPQTAPTRSSVNANVWEGFFRFATPVTSTFLQVKQRSFQLQRMERHINTEEVVIALDGPVIVPMAPPGELHQVRDQMIACYLPQGEGLILAPGAWHLAPFPLQETSSVLVIFNMDTPANDMEFQDLTPPARMIWE